MVASKRLTETYRELKKEAGDCLLLMQVGAFMQVMDEDARQVAAVMVWQWVELPKRGPLGWC